VPSLEALHQTGALENHPGGREDHPKKASYRSLVRLITLKRFRIPRDTTSPKMRCARSRGEAISSCQQRHRKEPQAPTTVADGAMVKNLDRYGALELLSPNAVVTPIVNPELNELVMFRIDRARADSLMWVEAAASAPSMNGVLYTSPYAKNPTGVVRRRVTAIEDQTTLSLSMVANAGYALIAQSEEHVLLVRLSDGMGWTINAEPN
jgi:hypothetical protein